jgi:hypothetical protein
MALAMILPTVLMDPGLPLIAIGVVHLSRARNSG